MHAYYCESDLMILFLYQIFERNYIPKIRADIFNWLIQMKLHDINKLISNISSSFPGLLTLTH